MDVFEFRNGLVDDYGTFITSFHNISDVRIRNRVEESLRSGMLWPEVMVQLNPAFKPGRNTDQLIEAGVFIQMFAEHFLYLMELHGRFTYTKIGRLRASRVETIL